ncbi:allergen Tha p 1-like [Pieris rapae]|uniref:allergen Tha p 1-like n=1 Tax=Pieris rapae TaxID=64459 RepID=UPI001E27F17A|nr:allergen Tha p 1-like [Pieris rapae]
MLAVCFLVYIVTPALSDYYSPRYDDFDINPLIENDRILVSYSKCFLDQGPCTPEAKDFKKVIPEALESSCGKCTPKQKQLIKTVIKAIMAAHPDTWDQLVNKYDGEKKYREEFNKFLKEKDRK